MTVFPVYRIQSVATPASVLYITIQSDISNDFTKEFDSQGIPFAAEVFIIDEQTVEQEISITTTIGISNTNIYTTAAALQTAITNVITNQADGGITLQGGTFDTSGSTFTADSTAPYQINGTSSFGLISKIKFTNADVFTFNLGITIIVGTEFF